MRLIEISNFYMFTWIRLFSSQNKWELAFQYLRYDSTSKMEYTMYKYDFNKSLIQKKYHKHFKRGQKISF